jgi:putative hemolysin
LQRTTRFDLFPIQKKKDLSPIVQAYLTIVKSLADRLLSIKKLEKQYHDLPRSKDPEGFVAHALNRLQIHHSILRADLSAIPSVGATVVIANHPFGGVDGLILASIFCSIRKDVKILANNFLGQIEEIRPLLITVDPFGQKATIRKNTLAIKRAIDWVKKGGLLVVFPAGEVSHFNWKTKKIEDPPWNKTVGRIIRTTRAKTVPVYFKGRNSLVFQGAGLLHPLLRTALLPREMYKKRSTCIHLKIGSTIHYNRIAGITSDSDLTAYLRFRTYLLGNAFSNTPGFLNTPYRPLKRSSPFQAIVAPSESLDLIREIDNLSNEQLLSSNGDLHVYVASAQQIPNIIHEIGRLREITFRRMGEGTAKSIDLDRFDDHYRHLFVWNSCCGEIVGAYRLALTDEVMKRYGRQGLYTHTLFAYQTRLLARIGPALELSRSFVRPKYQKNYAPLLLLWRGIGQLIVRHPQYKVLFGAVSITNEYTTYSWQLMTAFLKTHQFLNELSELVKPRKPFHPKAIPELEAITSSNWPEDIDELSSWISDIETDGRGVPILLKQYLKLGGKLLSFNIDPSFGNVLDGLIMVDLAGTDPKLLKRYMGAEGYAAFSAFHQEQYQTYRPPASQIPTAVSL